MTWVIGLLLPFVLVAFLIAVISGVATLKRVWVNAREEKSRRCEAFALSFVVEAAARPGRPIILRVDRSRPGQFEIEGAKVRRRGTGSPALLVEALNELLAARGERRRVQLMDWDPETVRKVGEQLGHIELWPRLRLEPRECAWIEARLARRPLEIDS